MLKPETVRWLQWALQRGRFSRAGLARELCERDTWRSPRGKLCAASARKACRAWRSSWGWLCRRSRCGCQAAASGGCGGLFRSSLPAACGNWERCGWNEPTRPAAAVRGSVASRASAGCGAGPRLSGAVSAGESARACGRAQFRSGASAPGAAGRASGLGRPHARGAHWGGGQRPVPDPARGAGAPTGQSRAGSGAAAAGAGRGAAARAAAAGAVGDLGSLPTSRQWDAGTPDPSTMRSMTTS